METIDVIWWIFWLGLVAIAMALLFAYESNNYTYIAEDGTKCDSAWENTYSTTLTQCEDGYDRKKATNYKKVLTYEK